MNFNDDGELMENTMIFDDGSVVFVDEHRMDANEIYQLERAILDAQYFINKYGTLDIFNLMDLNIRKNEMHKYLCFMRLLYAHGIVDGMEERD